MMNAPPKVTALMPCFNTRLDWLWTAIKGMATQSYSNLVLCIGDNGSTKASTLLTLEEAEETWPDRVRIARCPEKKGTAYALDAALKIADDDTVYLTKADSDDYFHRDREKNRVALFETMPPQVGLLYEDYMMLYADAPLSVLPIDLPDYDYRRFLDESFIPGNSMWRASVMDRWGGPVPSTFVYEGYEGKANHHAEDLALWLAITDHYDAYHAPFDPALAWTYRFYQRSKYSSDRKGVDYARCLLQYRAKERRGLLPETGP